MQRVVIVGGGFGGLYAARKLRREKNVEITLIDRRNHHLFQPLLYQVATASLNPSDIAMPIRAVLRHQHNTNVLLGEVTRVDVAQKRVVLADGAAVPYDTLVLATGATDSYFGHDEWQKAAPGLKTIEEALEIRRRIFLAFEAAERATDPVERRAYMTFVIVGGGATGVEMAGALGDIARQSLRHDFRRIDPAKDTRVLLVEGRDRLLPAFPPELSEQAAIRLGKMGVEVRTNTMVTGVDANGVTFGGGNHAKERIEARTVVWAAGVKASPLAASLGVPLDRAGRVLVRPDLTVPGHEEIFVIGDLAFLEQDGKPVPGVSPAAMQEGRHVAETIRRRLRGEATKPFRYFDKGNFAVIGRGAAVGTFRDKVNLKGFFAWLAWLFIHLFFLIGFRNRLLVLIDWAYQYLTFRQGARLITGDSTIAPGTGALPPPASPPRLPPPITHPAGAGASAAATASAGTAGGG